MKRKVRLRKECKPARGTHVLGSPDRETSQDMEKTRTSKGHSLSGEPSRRDKSGHGKNVSQQGALTTWRAQTEGQGRTPNASERSMRAQEKKSVRINILLVVAAIQNGYYNSPRATEKPICMSL